MGLFGTNTKKTVVKQTGVKECAKMVQIFLKKVGLNPSEHRIRQPNTLGWWVTHGSAVVYILINQGDTSSTIRVASPILFLPDDYILPFYRRLLEYNLNLINCALAVSDDKVLLVSERPLEGLDQNELEGMIHYLAGVADDIDDHLSNEFDAPMYAERV